LASDTSFKLSYASSGSFSDSGSISGYAAESVDYMSANGVINGVGNNRFDPKSSVTREQAIAIAVRMVDKLDTSPQTPTKTAQPTAAPDAGIHWVEVMIPAPDAAEEAVDVTAALALENYITARAYLDKFLTSDISSMNETQAAEYTEMLDNAIMLFENTEKLSDALTKAVDVWEKTDGGTAPTYRELSYTGQQSGAPTNLGPHALMKPHAGIMTRVFSADPSSVAWAKDITDRYDKAPAGKGIRTLASQLGTDAKHAYAQLKQAQAILEGATYTEIADAANTAYQTATVLKTAGTAAGLVISVAAAPAAGAVGAVVKTGGVVMGGINTILEIGSTGTILYTNGEGNELTAAFDKTESQMAPIGQIFSIAGLGYSLKDIGATGKKILESGYKSLTPKEMNDLGDNAFGVLSYAASSLNDYVNGGSILSGTFTKTDSGTKFTLVNTLLGNDENTKTALTNAGIDQNTINSALNGTLPAVAPSNTMPDSVSSSIINKNAPLVKEGGFDVGSFINKLMSTLTELGELSDIVNTPAATAAPDNGNYSTNPFEDGRIVTDVPVVPAP
ncbi:MAG: S-layer homology domain-containing protein, partial [Clostridia bacterium]|nr:S-layer homology domain-containing protein [Clostridia bacterium]